MGSRSIRNGLTISKRYLSAQEAAIALRPFYFAVHPDRFATMPDVREKNEKALQIFNGYLNDLYPQPSLSSSRPIKVAFSIKEKDTTELRDVNISLVGTDPLTIVRNALESCKLSSDHVKGTPRSSPSKVNSNLFNEGSHTMDSAYAHFWDEYMKGNKRTIDTASIVKKGRNEAIEKSKQHERTKVTLKYEIEDLKWRTGCKEIIWQMDWAESHMRRCLSNLHRLLDHSSKEDRDEIISCLLHNTIRFGRGSFICCDGSVQFGADNVPEQWQQVCLEGNVRRKQLMELEQTRKNLEEIFGGANIVCPSHRGLAQTLQQLNTLVVRISSRESVIRKKIATFGKDTMIEIVTSYDELAIGRDGRLLIPCNVDVISLSSFLQESSNTSRRINEEVRETLSLLRKEKDLTISLLGLSDLDWEDCLSVDNVLKAVERLKDAPQSLSESLKSLHVRFSANPTVHIRSDGKVSIPLDWN